MTETERALAKINLTLRVLGRASDGYHRLHSIVAFADVGERLDATPGGAARLSVTGPQSGALTTGGNLVLAADAAFRGEFPAAPRLDWRLDKHIPVAAGLGGGSADAGAALRVLARLTGVPLTSDRLAALAAGIGADVPVCLASRPSFMAGIGEVVRPLAHLPDLAVVLVNPGIALSTAAVFAALGLKPGECAGDAQPEAVEDEEASLRRAAIGGRNDLEAAARRVVPQIGAPLEAIRRTRGCLAARMTGSGATCFGIYDRLADAEDAARQIISANGDWWVRAARLASGRPPAVNATG